MGGSVSETAKEMPQKKRQCHEQRVPVQTSKTWDLEVPVRDQIDVAKFSEIFDWLR